VSRLGRMLGNVAAAMAASVGCSGPAAEPPIENEALRTHVVATVERQSVSGQTDSDDLSVLLSVLRMPQSVNADRSLRLMGLRTELPPLGNCEVIDLSSRASPALSSVERIEFLDVGDVAVTSGRRALPLARQAFPTVTDFIAGVVYTSRDKNADLLPLDSGLTIYARGTGKLKPFAVTVADLPRPTGIILDGVPLAAVSRLSVVDSFELRWDAGSVGDTLWLEFGATSGHKFASCAFDDAAGQAHVPGGLTDELGETRIVLHRLHSAALKLAGFDRAEMRFDSRVVQPASLY
jgi:hypothetical protein